MVTGRIANLHNDQMAIVTDMLDPGRMVNVRRGDIEEMKASPVSMMPEGLLDTLDRDEILDLIAYLLSRGDRENPMFRRVGVGLRSIAPSPRSGSEAFFNGKNFDGWEGLMEYWSVQDGTIVGKAPAEGLKFNTFLCSKKTYKDFELTFQVRIKDGKGNSGVQFRSRIVDAKNSPSPARRATSAALLGRPLRRTRPGRMAEDCPRRRSSERSSSRPTSTTTPQVRRQARHDQAQRHDHRR